MKNDQLEINISESIEDLLFPYLDKFFNYQIQKFPGVVVVSGQVNDKETSKTLVLKVLINHEDGEIYIPNIFVPEFMRRQGIGKKIISTIKEVADSYGYNLFIVDLVRSFYDRLVKRGAVVCKENDVVWISGKTDLSHKYI